MGAAHDQRTGDHRGARGGAWCDGWTDCLLSAQRRYLPGDRSARVGFGLARDASATIGYRFAGGGAA